MSTPNFLLSGKNALRQALHNLPEVSSYTVTTYSLMQFVLPSTGCSLSHSLNIVCRNYLLNELLATKFCLHLEGGKPQVDIASTLKQANKQSTKSNRVVNRILTFLKCINQETVVPRLPGEPRCQASPRKHRMEHCTTDFVLLSLEFHALEM